MMGTVRASGSSTRPTATSRSSAIGASNPGTPSSAPVNSSILARAASGNAPTTCTLSRAISRNSRVPSSTLAPGVASEAATTPVMGARSTKRVSRPPSP